MNLTGNADSVWTSPDVQRNDLCCTSSNPDRCVQFILTLDPGAQGIRFDVCDGALPPGALYYQIGCGTQYPVGDTLCLTGTGPFVVTFCKPGNNTNKYCITSIGKPKVSPPIAVSDGCSGIIYATGYDISTVVWTSVPYDSVYNTYMSCSAACDTVLVTAKPGYPPYVDYEVSGLPPGGCAASIVRDTVRVYFVSLKYADIQPKNPTVCFGGTTTSITANGNGGAPPYFYLWNTGATTQSINVGVGTYWVEIRDTTNCPPVYDTVTVTAFTVAISANAGTDNTVCLNNPSVQLNGSITAVTGGIWSGGSGTYSPADTILNATYTATNAEMSAGNFSLILTTTGNGTCPAASDTIKFIITPSPTVNAGIDVTACEDSSGVPLNGVVTISSGGKWKTTGTGTFSPNDSTLNAVYNFSTADVTAGSVKLILSTTGNGKCLTVTDTMNITLTKNSITASAGADTLICGNNITLNGVVTGASGGIWSATGTGTFSPLNTALNATYTFSPADVTAGNTKLILTTTGNAGCKSKKDTILVSIVNLITIGVTAPLTSCSNVNISLVGSTSTGSGKWATQGSGTFSPTDSTLTVSYNPSTADVAAGSVKIIFTTTNTGLCLQKKDTVQITIDPAPVAAFTTTNVCLTFANTFTDNSTTPAGTITNWGWNFGDAATSVNQNETHVYAAPGNYITTLIVTNSFGCKDTIAKSVIVHPLPTVNFSNTAQCFIDSVSYNDLSSVASPDSVTSWSWDFGDTTFSSSKNPWHFYTAPGTYTVTVITTTNNGCKDTAVQVVNAQPAPKAAYKTNNVCLNNTTLFTDSSTLVFGNIISRTWDFGDAGTSTSISPTHDYTAPGTYQVRLILVADNGCVDTLIKPYDVYPLPVASFNESSYCIGDGTTFNNTSTISSGSITINNWNFGDAQTDTSSSPKHNYSTIGSYTVALITFSDKGCSDTITKIISLNPSPVGGFYASPPYGHPGSTINFIDQSTGATSWTWDFGDTSGTSTSQNPNYLYQKGGTFIVRQVVINSFGCTDTVEHKISITPPPNVASGFTPNGDGANDLLLVMGGPYTNLEFRIFNNWGEMIFISHNQADGWDGTKKGVPQPLGVYVYTVKAVAEDGTTYNLSGDVTLIR